MDYAVCSNGAMVLRLHDGACLYSHTMTKGDALDCMELLAPFKPAWNGFFNNNAYFEWKGASYMLTGRAGAVARANVRNKGTMSPLRRAAWLVRKGVRYVLRMATNKSLKQVRSLRPHIARSKGGIQKIGCTITHRASCERAAALLEADGRFEVVRMGATELEITARGVSKGSGVAALQKALGISPELSVAFGDGGNDLPLVDVVGTFVAMGNADDEVKRAASDVCPSVMDDGVAVWIESRLLG